VLALLALSSSALAWQDWSFENTIARVENMVQDASVRAIAARNGLDVVNVTWEDTGRSKGSAVGPNISDMTIGVRDHTGALHPMPVLRFDNFTDVTADVRTDTFGLRVGNERGRGLRTLPLSLLLQDARSYLSAPTSWAGSRRSLWASRDTEVLVSAQACFLPIPRSREATFTPVLYNYQSSPGNPAVLAIVATREGTSMQVIENDAGYLSQPLFFNEAGERAPFVAERLTDWVAEGNGPRPSDAAAAGLNVVLVIQVPLKQAPPPPPVYGGWYDANESTSAPMSKSAADSDVEDAVIGHGAVEGPFREMDGLAIERDPRFPVRVTVQFYKATATGEITDADVRRIRAQIDRVYADASYVGSLVVDGYTERTTEWTSWPKPQPPAVDTGTATWADPFWSWHTP
jgi:hypothetical protein